MAGIGVDVGMATGATDASTASGIEATTASGMEFSDTGATTSEMGFSETDMIAVS